jgi:hypothetical protein
MKILVVNFFADALKQFKNTIIGGRYLLAGCSSELSDSVKGIKDLFNDIVIPALFVGLLIIIVIRAFGLGVKLLQSQSAEEKEKCKHQFIWLIIGAVICIAAPLLVPQLINIIISKVNDGLTIC